MNMRPIKFGLIIFLIFAATAPSLRAQVPALRAGAEVSRQALGLAKMIKTLNAGQLTVRGVPVKSLDPANPELFGVFGDPLGTVTQDLVDAVSLRQILDVNAIAYLLRKVPDSVLWEMAEQLAYAHNVPLPTAPSAGFVQGMIDNPIIISTLRQVQWLPSPKEVVGTARVDHGAKYWQRSEKDIQIILNYLKGNGAIGDVSEVARVEIAAIARRSVLPQYSPGVVQVKTIPSETKITAAFAKVDNDPERRIQLAYSLYRRLKNAIHSGTTNWTEPSGSSARLALAPNRSLSQEDINALRNAVQALRNVLNDKGLEETKLSVASARDLDFAADGTLRGVNQSPKLEVMKNELGLMLRELTMRRAVAPKPNRHFFPGQTARKIKRFVSPPKARRVKTWVKEKGGAIGRRDIDVPLQTADGTTSWLSTSQFPDPIGYETVTRLTIRDDKLFVASASWEGEMMAWDGPPKDAYIFKPDASPQPVSWELVENYTTPIYERTFDEVAIMHHANGMMDVYAPGEGHILSRLYPASEEFWLEVVPTAEIAETTTEAEIPPAPLPHRL